jgi:heme exporter protein C
MLSRFANPARFMRMSAAVLPWCAGFSLAVMAGGLVLALFVAPADYQQGEAVRIMYVHVPAAWMALSVYLFVAASSGAALIWRHPLAAVSARAGARGVARVWRHPRATVAARAAAPIGAAFTFVCLTSGSLWGRPMWGTWWVWDARLTSVLVLFFLYLGYIALVNAFDNPERGDRAGSVLALVGVINLPIIKFSVDWWNTLHQPASVLRFGGPAIALSMLVPLLVMAVGFAGLFVTLLLLRMRTALNEKKALALRLNGMRRAPARTPRAGAALRSAGR